MDTFTIVFLIMAGTASALSYGLAIWGILELCEDKVDNN